MLRVSLIMTCYNSIENYRASMENALQQDYPDIEFVVVDGGSTDGTVELIREYDARLREESRCDTQAASRVDGDGGSAENVDDAVVGKLGASDTEDATGGRTVAGKPHSGQQRRMIYVSEPDHGIYDGMNKGIRMATGDVIAVFNDLFTRPDAISLLITALEESGADGVHADLIYADQGVCKRWWRMGDGGMRVRDSDNTVRQQGAATEDGSIGSQAHDDATDADAAAGSRTLAARSAAGGTRRVTYPQIHTGWMPAHPTLYLRRAVYEQFGEYSLALPVSADFDYMLRILTGPGAIRLAYVPQTLISMFYGGASNGGLKGYAENIRQAYIALLRNHVAFPLTAIVCRTLRTMVQYQRAGEYRPID